MTVSVSSFAQEQQFLQAFQQALESQSFDRMILSQYQGELEQLEKMTFRVVMLQGQPVLSCLYRHKTQDVTKNYSLDIALETVAALLARCKQANLMTTEQEWQLKKNKKKAMLTQSKNKTAAKAFEQQGHDRVKQRFVDQDSYFLQPLGITDAKAHIIPSMARKWKQINKFVEIFSGALSHIQLPEQLRVVDFGSGKGYLTFALYDYLL
ncbi:MAG: SAM-dependent methyltransferase, partial [Acinetobacter sp.]|nr:SAM-dependent methyltransferase [Acinetobacter sp.]